MHPRYQVFVSSTFRDLLEERQAALEAILEMNHFPASMEIFPAADSTPWELIESIIADSDYYILIVGGRYGSAGAEGISYTEMEFDLAVKLNKPILAFLHAEPDLIPAGKSELEASARKKLDQFRAKVSSRICKLWKNKDELKPAVMMALMHAIRTKPAIGWVRNEGPDNQELLKRLAILQQKFNDLEVESEKLRALAAETTSSHFFQEIDEEHIVEFSGGGTDKNYQFPFTWSDIFFGIAEHMIIACPDPELKGHFNKLLNAAIKDTEIAREIDQATRHTRIALYGAYISQAEFNIITLQLMAQGLIEPEAIIRQIGNDGNISTRTQKCWKLTAKGRSSFIKKRAFPSRSQQPIQP